jgi:hypothetical protein
MTREFRGQTRAYPVPQLLAFDLLGAVRAREQTINSLVAAEQATTCFLSFMPGKPSLPDLS